MLDTSEDPTLRLSWRRPRNILPRWLALILLDDAPLASPAPSSTAVPTTTTHAEVS
jgi:hypothetical protein